MSRELHPTDLRVADRSSSDKSSEILDSNFLRVRDGWRTLVSGKHWYRQARVPVAGDLKGRGWQGVTERRNMRWLAALGLSAIVSCGGTHGAVSPSTSGPDSTSAPSTVVPPTATVTVRETSTTALATTSTTSSTTSTATAPTVAAGPTEPVLAASYLSFVEGYRVCLRAPTKCDPAVLTASAGPARASLTKTLADLVAGGFYMGDEDAGTVVVEAVKISGPTTVMVSSCWWDTGVLYGPPAQSGGPPLIINDLQATSRFETTMTLEGGRWLTSEERRVSRVEGENQCPPES